jgi:hypothetical protein
MVYVSFARRMLLPHKRLLTLVFMKCLLLFIVIRVVSYHKIMSLNKTNANNQLLDHPMLLYMIYIVSKEVMVAFSPVCCCWLLLLSSATAPSYGQLSTVNSTLQNCCSSQRFLCFYMSLKAVT